MIEEDTGERKVESEKRVDDVYRALPVQLEDRYTAFESNESTHHAEDGENNHNSF